MEEENWPVDLFLLVIYDLQNTNFPLGESEYGNKLIGLGVECSILDSQNQEVKQSYILKNYWRE